MDPFERLPPALADAVDAARPRFATHVTDVRYRAVVPSTMDVATQLARDGAPHGLVIVAGEQSAGRGRRGHAWSSPPDAGLYFSAIVRPPVTTAPDGEPHLMGVMTLAAGLAVAEGVGHATGLEASLKWPNDLYYGYKFAGVLAEGHEVGTPAQFVVLGVGINVRDVEYLTEQEGRATSIEREVGQPVDAGRILAEVLAAWAMRYDDLLGGRFARVVDRWRVRATGLMGRPVAWVDASGEREGTTTGVDRSGALLVDTGTEVVRLTGGAVRWQ